MHNVISDLSQSATKNHLPAFGRINPQLDASFIVSSPCHTSKAHAFFGLHVTGGLLMPFLPTLKLICLSRKTVCIDSSILVNTIY